MRHGAGGFCHSHLIRFISFLLATRSLVAGAAGRMGIRGTVSRCSPLVHYFSCPYRFLHLIDFHRSHCVPIPSLTKQENEG